MKQTIRDVLDDMSNSQVNLESSAARETISSLISVALKTKGFYTEYSDSEIEEQNARATWVCSICGENTADVDYDYLGSGTNHLGCELKSQEEIDEYIEDIDEQAYAQGRESSYDESRSFESDDIPEGLKAAKRLSHDALEEASTREKNWIQKKHEDKVFDPARALHETYSVVEHLGYATKDKKQKKIGEITEQQYRNLLSEQIVDNKGEGYIYESPDGGKTVYRREFGSDKKKLIWSSDEKGKFNKRTTK